MLMPIEMYLPLEVGADPRPASIYELRTAGLYNIDEDKIYDLAMRVHQCSLIYVRVIVSCLERLDTQFANEIITKLFSFEFSI